MRKWENHFNNVFTQGLSLPWADVLDQGCGDRETRTWKMGSQMLKPKSVCTITELSPTLAWLPAARGALHLGDVPSETPGRQGRKQLGSTSPP